MELPRTNRRSEIKRSVLAELTGFLNEKIADYELRESGRGRDHSLPFFIPVSHPANEPEDRFG